MAEYIKVPAGVYDMVTRCMEQEFPDHVAIRYVAEDGKTVVEKKYRGYAQDIRRMIELAHAAGFAVMAHANGDRAVTAALQAGVDSIEHGAYLSESVLLRMAQQRTLWVPTLSTIGNLIGSGRYPDAVLKRLLAQQQEAVRFVAAHGGKYTAVSFSLKKRPRRCFDYFLSPAKCSFVTLMTTGLSSSSAMRFGMDMRPLSVSEISHTSVRSATAPATTTRQKMT